MANISSSNYLVDKEPTALSYIPIFHLDINLLLLLILKNKVLGEKYQILSH